MEVLQTSALTTWLRRRTVVFYAKFGVIVKTNVALGWVSKLGQAIEKRLQF